jgi:polysaccharide export outer membrane protein
MLGAGCASTSYDYSKEPDPRKSEYTIGVGDDLRISVWKFADLSTAATVRPDGTITLPLVGDLLAVGRTPSQLRNEITQRIAAFIKDESATVSVAVTAVNSYRFTLSGNFEHNGIFTSKYYVTIADAVALGGGLNKFATSKLVVIRGDGAGNVRRIPVDYARISAGDHTNENLVLLAGDTLFAR